MTTRLRLNRGGNRQANAALYRIALSRLRWHDETIAYMHRRLAEGKTRREIIRCLKRSIADSCSPSSATPNRPAATPRSPLDIHRGIGLKGLPDTSLDELAIFSADKRRSGCWNLDRSQAGLTSRRRCRSDAPTPSRLRPLNLVHRRRLF